MPPQGEESTQNSVLDYTWSIRPCDTYHEEYSDCCSIKARFQQYFIYGKSIDCSQWKRDYENCVKFKETKDLKAARALIESEKDRRTERFRGHYANDVWMKRDAPPKDWDKPLPEAIQKQYEASYLAVKAKEMKGEKVAQHPSDFTSGMSCTIM